MKKKNTYTHVVTELEVTATIEGRSRTTSTSKMRNTIVIKKNRREKGTRKLEFLSKPHSKGDLFSRFITPFLARTIVRSSTAVVIVKINIAMAVSWIIIFSQKGHFDWKSNILVILKRLVSSSVD